VTQPGPAAPRVTVLLPVHNGQRWLGEAVGSVLGQTFGDLELLVVDDGSTDATPEILAGVDDPRLRVVRNPENLGLVGALNRGLGEARGELVARMDADDVCRPDRLARQVAYLDAHPEVGIVGSRMRQVDADGHPVTPIYGDVPTSPGRIRWLLWWHNVVNHPTVVIRRRLLEEVGGWAADAWPADDYDLWLRAADRAGVANLADVLLDYRWHDTNMSVTEAEAMLAQALDAAARAQARALGRPVPAATISLVRVPDLLREGAVDGATARTALVNLAELTRRWERDHAPTEEDRALVTREAATWVAALVLASARRQPRLAVDLLRHRAGLPLGPVVRGARRALPLRPRWLRRGAA
jgi:hypothetical protein